MLVGTDGPRNTPYFFHPPPLNVCIFVWLYSFSLRFLCFFLSYSCIVSKHHITLPTAQRRSSVHCTGLKQAIFFSFFLLFCLLCFLALACIHLAYMAFGVRFRFLSIYYCWGSGRGWSGWQAEVDDGWGTTGLGCEMDGNGMDVMMMPLLLCILLFVGRWLCFSPIIPPTIASCPLVVDVVVSRRGEREERQKHRECGKRESEGWRVTLVPMSCCVRKTKVALCFCGRCQSIGEEER
jgi:hypothetical protein